jgi:hypothetical protein
MGLDTERFGSENTGSQITGGVIDDPVSLL